MIQSAILAGLAALPSGGYNPDEGNDLLEYIGVGIAFLLAAFVVWLLIRKDLKAEKKD